MAKLLRPTRPAPSGPPTYSADDGFADYLLFVHGKAVGVLEAKPAGYALTNVELQADKYAGGLPAGLNPPVQPLPFLYLSTGVETRFINGLDPEQNPRAIDANLPHIHRPATLAEWIQAETLEAWVKRLYAGEGGLLHRRGRHSPLGVSSALSYAVTSRHGKPLPEPDRGRHQVGAKRQSGHGLSSRYPSSNVTARVRDTSSFNSGWEILLSEYA